MRARISKFRLRLAFSLNFSASCRPLSYSDSASMHPPLANRLIGQDEIGLRISRVILRGFFQATHVRRPRYSPARYIFASVKSVGGSVGILALGRFQELTGAENIAIGETLDGFVDIGVSRADLRKLRRRSTFAW